MKYATSFFGVGLVCILTCFASSLICRFIVKIQFWPPPEKTSWQYHFIWNLIRVFYVCVIGISWIEVLNNYQLGSSLFYFYVIAMALAFLLAFISSYQLGWKNTHGEAIQFVTIGFYKYSRNPQYVLCVVAFIFWALAVNSVYTNVLLFLISIAYLLMPFAEEDWLQLKYGEEYLNYKSLVPRYVGKPRI